MSGLTPAQRADWVRDGWLHQRGAIAPERVTEIRAWVDTVAGWGESDGPGLHHFEATDQGPRIARSEDLLPHHAGLRALITSGTLVSTAGELFGEPALIFKEKINYKHPGGGGFAPHQDATAYRFVDHHISCMVPIDPATRRSGCLYVAPGYGNGRLPTDDRGRVAEAHAAGLDWRPVEVEPGDVLWFDSYTPHYSETNTTDRPRRAIYLTYNAAADGDWRSTYYDDKASEFSRSDGTFGRERVRISITDDFLGRPVAVPPVGDAR